MNHEGFAVGTVILAAGRSSRMGRPKLLLPWGETTILGHLIARWERLGAAETIVVHGANQDLWAELDRLKFSPSQRVKNPKPSRGMFSSIQCAASWDGWKPNLTHFAIVLGDQPHVRENTLMALLELARSNPGKICQPEWNDRPKHPVIIPRNVFAQLESSTAKDLKEFLHNEKFESARIKSDDPGLNCDIDYQEDYKRAKRMFFSNTG